MEEMRSTQKALCRISKGIKLAPFFHGITFLLKRMTATETMFIQIEWCLEDVSHDQSESVTSKTTTNCIDASNKI